MPAYFGNKSTVEAGSGSRDEAASGGWAGRAAQSSQAPAYRRPRRANRPRRAWQYRPIAGQGVESHGGVQCSDVQGEQQLPVLTLPPSPKPDFADPAASEATGLQAAEAEPVEPAGAKGPTQLAAVEPALAPMEGLAPAPSEEVAVRPQPQYTAEQMMWGLARILTCMAARAPEEERLTVFHSSYAPRITVITYISRILRNFDCSKECMVLALIYIDRLVKRHPTLTVSALSVHRLVLIAMTMAAKFHDDRFYSNQHYAKVGGLRAFELSGLERRFLFNVDWRLCVSPEDYNLYLDLIGQALSGKFRQPVRADAAIY